MTATIRRAKTQLQLWSPPVGAWPPGPPGGGTARPTWGGTSRTAVGKRGGTHFSMVRAQAPGHARMGEIGRRAVIANLRLMASTVPGSRDGEPGPARRP